ncbi:hypothetical protein DFH06DRAFT_1024174 [Mycena polygramma]|nr:hypothetical protein DFH06DRAFT_1024174 [Mycena polygramma]
MATPSMPSRGDRNAPTFDSTKPREISRYFSDLEYHFTRCNVTVDTDKKSHATRFLSVRDQDAWESLKEFKDATNSYGEFKAAALKLYPGTDAEKKFTLADLDVLIGRYARSGIHSKGDLSEFYIDFSTISTYLIEKGRLSAGEQSRSFARAMQPPSLWDRMLRRLEVKQPDVDPEDYDLENLKEAADFVLRGTTVSSTTLDTQSTLQPKKEPDMPVWVTKLIEVLAVNNQHANHGHSHAPYSQQSHAPYPPPNSKPRPEGCIYCSGPHYIGSCELVVTDTQAGYCKRDVNGKVVLPSGAFVPGHFQGRNLRERFQEYHRANPGQTAVAQMMLDTRPKSTFAQTSGMLSIEERQRRLEQEMQDLDNLRHAQFIQTRAQAQRSAEAGGPIEEPEQPIRRVSQPAQSHVAPAPASAATHAPIAATHAKVPEHPYAKVRDAAYAPPAGRNFGVKPPTAPPAKRSEPAYRSAPPVMVNKIITKVFHRSLDAPVTITQRELLSIAPELRTQYKDVTTNRRVPTETQPLPTAEQFLNSTDEAMAFETEPVVGFEDPKTPRAKTSLSTFLSSMPAAFENTVAEDPGELHVAADSCALRSVLPIVDNQRRVEAIYDTGSQIIGMSEAICNDLGLPYDPRITISMESANGSVSSSLGLARNVPFGFKDITLYLQCHIVRAPAYDILLGRPFDQLTECKVNNSANGDQTLTIRDRNTGTELTLPTIPRGRPRPRAQDFCSSMN